ncbi:MAG: PsiF family protein [Burkholderiales bacterium]
MKKIIVVSCLALLTMSVPAAAEQVADTKACTAEAAKKALKGDKRTAFVKNCLAAKAKPKSDAAGAAPGPKPAKPDSAATPPAPSATAVDGKARQRCEDLARQSNVSPAKKNEFMSKCMAG